jgi:hypothetical protein
MNHEHKNKEKQEKIILAKQNLIQICTEHIELLHQKKSKIELLVITLNDTFNNLDIRDRTDELLQEHNQNIIEANDLLTQINLQIEILILELNKHQLA